MLSRSAMVLSGVTVACLNYCAPVRCEDNVKQSQEKLHPKVFVKAKYHSKLKLTGNNHKPKLIHFLRHAQGIHNVAAETNYAAYLQAEYFDAPVRACLLFTTSISSQFTPLSSHRKEFPNAYLLVISTRTPFGENIPLPSLPSSQ